MTAPPPLHVSGGARSRTAGALRKSTAAHETLVGLLVAVLVVVAVSAVVLYQYWEVRELKLERQAALHKSHEWSARQSVRSRSWRSAHIRFERLELNCRAAVQSERSSGIHRMFPHLRRQHIRCALCAGYVDAGPCCAKFVPCYTVCRIKIEREREEAQVLRTELEHAKKVIALKA